MTKITSTCLMGLALSLTLALPALAQTTPTVPFIVEWDQSGDGQVTPEEMHARRDDLFTTFDADENGLIEGEELAAMAETSAAMHDAKAEDRAAMQAMHHGMQGAGGGTMRGGQGQGGGMGGGMGGQRAAAAQTADPFLPTAAIDRAGFIAIADQQFQWMDRNGDGIITAADFGM